MQHAVRPCSVTALLARYLESRCNEHRSWRKGQTSIASSARHSTHEKLAAEAIVLERARHPSLATAPSSIRPTISFLLFFPSNHYRLYCSAFLPPTFRSSHCTHHFFLLLVKKQQTRDVHRPTGISHALSLFSPLPSSLPFSISVFLSLCPSPSIFPNHFMESFYQRSRKGHSIRF